MEIKELKYLVQGLSSTFGEFYGELYDSLVVKGKKRMGQEAKGESPQISELIKRTREKQTIQELLSKGKQGQDELIKSIGVEVKKKLAGVGIVTRTDFHRVEKRLDEIEEVLAEKGK